jgi:parallel beta-helix repeat protein
MLRGMLPLVIVFMMTVGGAYLPPMDPGDEPIILVVGEGGYESVNDALKVAEPFDIIRVRPGIYSDPVIINKPVKIYGNGPMTVYTSTMIVSANDVFVSGHTFQTIYNNATAHDWDFGGIVTRQIDGPHAPDSLVSRLTVDSCTFRNNRQGVFLFGAKDSTVKDCDFYGSYRGVTIGPHLIGNTVVWTASGNTVTRNNFYNMVGDGIYDGEAVHIFDSDSNIVSLNTMDGNSYGVSIDGGTGNTVTSNTITDSTYNPVVLTDVVGLNSATISQNDIKDNARNLLLDSSTGVTVNTNTFTNNGGPIELRGSSQVSFTGNTISDSSVFLNASSDNTFIGNEFASTDAPTFLFAGQKTDYDNDIRTSNTVGGKAIHYYYNDNNVNLASVDVGSILLAWCADASITDTKVTDGDGIWLFQSVRANIEAEVTNCLYGISSEGGTDITLDGCNINTSTRGWQGVGLSVGHVGRIDDSTIVSEGTGPAFLLKNDSRLSAYNTTFDGDDVNATDGILYVYNYLDIMVWDDGRLQALEGAELEVTADGSPVYSTPHFGGTDSTTDPGGVITDIVLMDREYDHNNTATEHVHNVTVWMQIDAIWTDSVNDLDMSGPISLVFEASDIRAPATPLSLVVLDVPNLDSIEITWQANTDDTAIYSLYSNITGEWAVLENQTMTAYTISTGLVHDGRYWFAVSAWDEVPLESPWSGIVGVVHADALAPLAPTGLEALLVTGTEITLGWAANTEADLEGYNLYVNEPGGDETGPWIFLDGGLTSLQYVVQSLTSETMYHFALAAYDEVPNESPFSVVLSVATLDITPPLAPLIDELPRYTNVESLVVTGTAEPGSTVTVFLGAVDAGSVVVEEDGTFTTTVTLTEGTNLVTAWATDPSGNTGPLSAEGSVILDLVAPEAPVLDLTPDITNVVELTVSGTVEPLTTVTVTLNGEAVLTLETDEEGDFQVTFDLEEGENTIAAFATDTALNVGPSVERTVRLDTVAPVVLAGDDATSIEGDEVTLDGSGSSDDIGIDNFEWTFTWDGTDESLDGDVVKFTFNKPGTVTVTLTVTDLAGNEASDEVVLTIDVRNGPPTLRRGGLTPTKGTTSTDFTFEVEFTDPDGDEGEVWVFIDGESYIMTADPDDTDSTDGRTYTYTTKLTRGEHTYYFTGRDELGNDAGGPSAGEGNSASSPDVSKKKTEESPGPGAAVVIVAVVIAILVLEARRRRT